MALIPLVKDGSLPVFPCSEELFLDALKRCETPDVADDYGRTALCVAIKGFRSAGMVKTLLELGADPNAVSSIDRIFFLASDPRANRFTVRGTPLHVAVTVGNLEIIDLLLAKGADINQKTSKGFTALQLALKTEVYLGKERELSEDGNLDLIAMLLAAGADVNAPNPERADTLLHRATLLGNDKIVRLLLSTHHQWDINARDEHGGTVLHLACNNARLTEVLLQNGADPNITCPSGNTPYHDASRKGNMEVMEILYKYGANPNVVNNRGFTALHSLAMDHHPDIDAVNAVLSHGADLFANDLLGRTPHYYIRSFRIDEAGRLLCLLAKAGGGLNRTDSFGSPLWHSIVHSLLNSPDIIEDKDGNKEVLEQIVGAYVKTGVNINAIDLQNRTVLHLAVAHGILDLVDVLLTHGADVNARDCDGNTPLHLAAKHVFVNVIRMLKTAKHARTDIPNFKMETVDAILAMKIKELQSSFAKGKTRRFAQDTYHSGKGMRSLEEDIALLTDVTRMSSQHGEEDDKQPRETSGIADEQSEASEQRGIQPLGASTHWKSHDLKFLSKYLREDHILFSLLLHKETKHPIEIDEDDGVVYDRGDAMTSDRSRFADLSSRILEYCETYSVGRFHLNGACEDEKCEIARQVRSLVQELVEKCSQMDPRLNCKLIQAGSTAEGTEMWAPDEFDFMMELSNLEGRCYIERAQGSIETYLYLNEDAKSTWGEFLQDGRFAPKQLRNYIAVLLWKASFSLHRDKFPNLRFNLAQYHRNVCSGCYGDQPLVKYSKVGALLRLQWLGDQFQELDVDVDITPAIKLQSWAGDDSLPSSLRYLQEYGSHVVPLGLSEVDVNWRVSFAMAECRLMQDLSEHQLNVYKALKLLQDIPLIDRRITGKVPSYLLKMLTFNYLFKRAGDRVDLASRVHDLLCGIPKGGIDHFFMNAAIPVDRPLFPHWIDSALAALRGLDSWEEKKHLLVWPTT